MAANRSGLQLGTLRSLVLAWVLTLPVCVLLGAATFAAGLFVVLNHLLPALLWIGGIALALLIAWWVREHTGRRPVRVGV